MDDVHQGRAGGGPRGPNTGKAPALGAMSDALFRKLAGFTPVDPRFAETFRAMCVERVAFEAGARPVAAASAYNAVYLLDEGWMIRKRHLPNGARQIVSIVLPGDFVGLNALMFETADFDHDCRTPVCAFRFAPADLRRALEAHPSVGQALFWVTSHEENLLAERVVSLGRRTATERTAHLLAELLARIEIFEEPLPARLEVPLTQEDIADAVGISAVHANKVLRALHRDGVATLRNGLLEVHDRRGLERRAGFEHGYLHFTRRADPAGF